MTPNNGSRSGEGGRGGRPRRPAARLAAPWGIERRLSRIERRLWRVDRRLGGAGPLFSDSEPTAPALRAVRVLEVDGPALVLGSTQPRPQAEAATFPVSDAVEVVRRRSGGGAVLLRPDETVWVDVVIPAGDPLWEGDVGRSFHWLGDTWVAALQTLGLIGRVHRGGLVPSRWSPAVCFAGVGPGEVLDRAGRKIVGMASRRTRDWALFQCAVPLVWDPAAYVELLRLPPEATDDLAGVVAPLPPGTAAGDVADAFVAALQASVAEY